MPPVVEDGYEAKGNYIDIDGHRTCMTSQTLIVSVANSVQDRTGKEDSTTAVLIVSDIFGFFPQSLQGADILAYGDQEKHYQVFIPDYFNGNPADISWFPPDNDEKKEKLDGFFEKFPPPETAQKIPKLVDAIKSKYGVKTLGILGYCWGGKVVNLSITADTPFKAAAICHPVGLDAEDASNVSIPIAILPSKDEDEALVGKYMSALKVKHITERFPDQVHGWMAARYVWIIDLIPSVRWS